MSVKVVGDRLLKPAEAAEYLQCTENTLRCWVSRRRVPHVKIGRSVRFRLADLEAFVEKNLVKPVAA